MAEVHQLGENSPHGSYAVVWMDFDLGPVSGGQWSAQRGETLQYNRTTVLSGIVFAVIKLFNIMYLWYKQSKVEENMNRGHFSVLLTCMRWRGSTVCSRCCSSLRLLCSSSISCWRSLRSSSALLSAASCFCLISSASKAWFLSMALLTMATTWALVCISLSLFICRYP